jgi:hypothetical protein
MGVFQVSRKELSAWGFIYSHVRMGQSEVGFSSDTIFFTHANA